MSFVPTLRYVKEMDFRLNLWCRECKNGRFEEDIDGLIVENGEDATLESLKPILSCHGPNKLEIQVTPNEGAERPLSYEQPISRKLNDEPG